MRWNLMSAQKLDFTELSSFFPGSLEVRGRISFSNMFANTTFACGVPECVRTQLNSM